MRSRAAGETDLGHRMDIYDESNACEKGQKWGAQGHVHARIAGGRSAMPSGGGSSQERRASPLGMAAAEWSRALGFTCVIVADRLLTIFGQRGQQT
jgi:hypothetical protein